MVALYSFPQEITFFELFLGIQGSFIIIIIIIIIIMYSRFVSPSFSFRIRGSSIYFYSFKIHLWIFRH